MDETTGQQSPFVPEPPSETPAEIPPAPPPLPDRSTLKWRLLTLFIAVTGGLGGIVGAFIQETFRGGWLTPFVAGPIIEEALKPVGIYIILAKWPNALTSRLYTAFLTALSGLVFGVIENLVYMYVYFPEHSTAFLLIRWTAGLALHTGCSFIVGFGLDFSLISGIKGETKLFASNKRFFIIAMAIHSAYNISAFVLSFIFRI